MGQGYDSIDSRPRTHRTSPVNSSDGIVVSETGSAFVSVDKGLRVRAWDTASTLARAVVQDDSLMVFLVDGYGTARSVPLTFTVSPLSDEAQEVVFDDPEGQMVSRVVVAL